MTPSSADWTGARWWLSTPDPTHAPVAPLTVDRDLGRLALPEVLSPLGEGAAPPDGVARRHWGEEGGWVACGEGCAHGPTRTVTAVSARPEPRQVAMFGARA